MRKLEQADGALTKCSPLGRDRCCSSSFCWFWRTSSGTALDGEVCCDDSVAPRHANPQPLARAVIQETNYGEMDEIFYEKNSAQEDQERGGGARSWHLLPRWQQALCRAYIVG
jgi:hypothetical protein